jgi:DNA (cytosine-5)-methyltransferase 1
MRCALKFGKGCRSDNDNRPVAANSNSTGEPLRFLSVCSGIEAASVAWPNWEAVAFSEIEKFPSAVLAHRYPDVPNLGDFTEIDTTKLGRVDILCGGTPCQAFSVAGLRGSPIATSIGDNF